MSTTMDVKPTTDADKVGGSQEDWKERCLVAERENQALKSEIAKLQALLAENFDYESNDDDEAVEDDNSVCDGTPWSIKYFMLKQYKEEHGDCMVPFKFPQLGNWVNDQKKAFKNKKLRQERIDKLNKIGFYWGKGHPKPPTWDDYYQELKAHYKDFGECNVFVDPDPAQRSALATWVVTQRQQGKRLRNLMPSSLSREQYKLLEEVSFPWKGSKKRRR